MLSARAANGGGVISETGTVQRAKFLLPNGGELKDGPTLQLNARFCFGNVAAAWRPEHSLTVVGTTETSGIHYIVARRAY
jgi:hypothetical protein